MKNPKIRLIEHILRIRKKRKKDEIGVFPYISSPKVSAQDKDLELAKKGTEFEAFVVKRFDPVQFTLIEWRSDKVIDGIFPAMSKFPDLEFCLESQSDCSQFAIECKWKEHFYKEGITLDKYQLENYKTYEEITGNPTFIIIGVGNTPSSPRIVYIIPLKDVAKESFHEFELEVYRRKDPHEMFKVNYGSPIIIR
jgi:hypothetical protein